VSAQGSCTITPTSPDHLTVDGKELPDTTQKVMIECRCVDDKNTSLSRVRWFGHNNIRIMSQSDTPTGAPYFINKKSGRLATLVIPTFNDSYDGTYTCGMGTEYPPNPITSITLTLAGEKYHMLNINTIMYITDNTYTSNILAQYTLVE